MVSAYAHCVGDGDHCKKMVEVSEPMQEPLSAVLGIRTQYREAVRRVRFHLQRQQQQQAEAAVEMVARDESAGRQ